MIFFFKGLLEKCEGFVLNIYESLLSLIRIVVLTRASSRFPIPEKTTCLVLGNGPSLGNILKNDTLILKEYDLICVNHFPASGDYVKIKPQNCIWLDPAFYQDNRPALADKTIDAIIKETSWPVNLFLPAQARKKEAVRKINASNSFITIRYFNYTIVNGFQWFRHLLYKYNLGMPQCQNVLAAALFRAINAGYSRVFLLGADHTWIKDMVVMDDNELYIRSTHFYTEENKTPLVKLKDVSGKKRLITEFLISAAKAFKSYYLLQEYACYCNVKVYNATPGSYIDAFDRASPFEIPAESGN
jgi:hypothetical protein